MKTEAGRTEMRTRSLVAERVRRNLLLLIDGIKTDEVLLASVSGATREDIERLQELGLVEPLAPASPAPGTPSTWPSATTTRWATSSSPPASPT